MTVGDFSEQEKQEIRSMLIQSKIKDGHLSETITALRDEIKALRNDVIGEVRSLKDRVSRLEKFQWLTLGGLGFMLTGLPGLVYLVKLIEGQSP